MLVPSTMNVANHIDRAARHFPNGSAVIFEQ